MIDASSFTLDFQIVSGGYRLGMLLVFLATRRGANPFQKPVLYAFAFKLESGRRPDEA